MELANDDTINTKALVAREKLFIAKTSKINRYNLRVGVVSFSLIQARSL